MNLQYLLFQDFQHHPAGPRVPVSHLTLLVLHFQSYQVDPEFLEFLTVQMDQLDLVVQQVRVIRLGRLVQCYQRPH